MFGVQSGTGKDFSPSTSFSPCQQHTTKIYGPLIHLSPTLYNLAVDSEFKLHTALWEQPSVV
jgi:hypothetical protein